MTHWTSLDVCVLCALSFCLGSLPNLLKTFMSPSREMAVIIADSIASQLSFTGFAAEAHIPQNLGSSAELQKLESNVVFLDIFQLFLSL